MYEINKLTNEMLKNNFVDCSSDPSTVVHSNELGMDSSSKTWAKIGEFKTHVQAKHPTYPAGEIGYKTCYFFRLSSLTSYTFEVIEFGVVVDTSPSKKIMSIVSNVSPKNMMVGLYYNNQTEKVELWATTKKFEQLYLQKINGDTKGFIPYHKQDFNKMKSELNGMVLLNNVNLSTFDKQEGGI